MLKSMSLEGWTQHHHLRCHILLTAQTANHNTLISSFHFTIQDKHLCSSCNSYTADNGSSIKTINTLWNDKEIKLQQNISNILRKKKKKRLTTYFLQTLFNDFKHNRLQNNTVGKKSFRNFDFHEGSWFWHVIIAAPRDFFNLWIINKYSSI